MVLGLRATNQLDDGAHVRGIAADVAVGKREVFAPARAQDRPRRLAFLNSFLGGAVGAELAPGQVAQADAMTKRGVLGNGAAEPDLEIVRMRAKDEQIDALGHRPILFGSRDLSIQPVRVLRRLLRGCSLRALTPNRRIPSQQRHFFLAICIRRRQLG